MWSECPGAPTAKLVLLVRQFMVQRNFCPRDSMLVASLAPIAPARTQKEQNLWLLQQSIPRATQHGFVPIRGVHFWVDNDMCQNCFTWKCLTRPPTNWNTCFRPFASSVRDPGDSHVAWYHQGKGHFCWAMYLSENDDNLAVKWIRGRLPAGEVRWARWW